MREVTSNIADAGSPAVVVNPNGSSPVVVVCEHASKYIPACLGTMGLSEADRTSHIAWDIGAEQVARHLAQLLDAPLVMQRYSRLVYDCNRPPNSPSAIPQVSELTRVPGNEQLSEAELQARIDQIYQPFHARVGDVLDGKMKSGIQPVLVTVHSFTPVFKSVTRDFELGILHDADSRLGDVVLEIVQRSQDYSARRNEPYGPADGVTHTLNIHSCAQGLLNVMFEIRNDLVVEEAGQTVWADRLARCVDQALQVVSSGRPDHALAAKQA